MRKLTLEELNRIDIESFKTKEKLPAIVILDNIRSQYNIGSIFRTCDAFRISSLYLCGITACPPSREIEKSALGATQSVDWQYFEDTIQAIHSCKENNFTIIAVEQTTESIDIRKMLYASNQKVAFIFGNEVKGISDNVLPYCDKSIEIPQFGTKHSFNVSSTAAIVLYDYFNKISKHIKIF